MVGCHKTSTDMTHRGFSTGEYDELAIWKRKLMENETIFFYGGFSKEFFVTSFT